MDINWKENIDHILLMYEASIEDEVQRTISVYESLSPPPNVTVASCFFDILTNRTTETLRKAQLGYIMSMKNASNANNSTDDRSSDVVFMSPNSSQSDIASKTSDQDTIEAENDPVDPKSPPKEQSVQATTDQAADLTPVDNNMNSSEETVAVEPMPAVIESEVTADASNAPTCTVNTAPMETSSQNVSADTENDTCFEDIFSDIDTISDCSHEEDRDALPKSASMDKNIRDAISRILDEANVTDNARSINNDTENKTEVADAPISVAESRDVITTEATVNAIPIDKSTEQWAEREVTGCDTSISEAYSDIEASDCSHENRITLPESPAVEQDNQAAILDEAHQSSSIGGLPSAESVTVDQQDDQNLKRKMTTALETEESLSKRRKSPPQLEGAETESVSIESVPLEPANNINGTQTAGHLVPIPRNSNPNIYWRNSAHELKCIVCCKTSENVASHYRIEHPELDVYISRPSPPMVQRLMSRKECTISKGGLITGFCFFCEQSWQKTHTEWKYHHLTHTGELEFFCTECRSQLQSKEAHGSCSTNNISSVWDEQNSSGAMMAFLCRWCNYIQVHKSHMMRHLEHEHDTIDTNFNRNIEKITLLPDLHPISWQLSAKHQFVNEKYRFCCTIAKCNGEFFNQNDFKNHFSKYHQNETKFQCPHCSTLIKKLHRFLVTDIINHFYLHGTYLNECGSCGEQFGSEYESLHHIARVHSVENILIRLSVIESQGEIEKKEFTIWLACNVCQMRFESPHKAADHFLKMHKSYYLDCLAVKSVKRTAPDGTTSCFTPKERTTHTFRRSLNCNICNRPSRSKSALIAHFNCDHPRQEIVVKLGKIYVTDSKRDSEYMDSTALNFDNHMVFYCVACRDANNNREPGVAFDNVQGVHAHWMAVHSKPPELKPFQFHAIEFVSCSYCKLIGSFHEIKRHQKEAHSKEPFLICSVLNPKKCALCDYTNDDLARHLKTEHELVLRMDNFNPTQFTDDTLNKLMAIDVHSKHKCAHCDEIFETTGNVEAHIIMDHRLPIKYHTFFDNDSVKIVTGCCQTVINLHEFLDHLSDPNHQFPAVCSKCNFETTDLFEFVDHQVKAHQMAKDADSLYRRLLRTRFWATRVIFGNGLVLTKHNLLGTEFDDSKPFEGLMEQLLVIARDKLYFSSNEF